MGQIAFTVANVAGALVASYFGGPFAGAAAFAAGEALATYALFPAHTNQEGPRLQDLQVTGQTYGVMRPICYGRVRVPGKMIWLLGNQLDERTGQQGSGVKGGGGVTTYSYYASMAHALCEGPAQSVNRLWGDGKLFYSWDGVTVGSVQEKYPGVVLVYTGVESQNPDPVIQAGRNVITGYAMVSGGSGYAVGDTGGIGGGNSDMGYQVLGVGGGGAVLTLQLFGGTGYVLGPTYPLHRGGTQEGHGNNASLRFTSMTSGATQVPAWRDTCYVRFDQLPLADFANHLPMITAEVVMGPTPISLGSIVHDLCRRAGLADDQLDTSALTDSVDGFIVTRRTSARATIASLAEIFLFDAVESNDQLVFLPRGRAPLFQIGEAALGAHDAGEQVPPALTLQHVQEVEVPERVELTYINKDRNYQDAMQYGARVQAPIPTQFSRQRRQVQAPLVLSDDAAKAQALKMLYAAWVGRDLKQFTGSQALSRLDPADVITIQAEGRTHTVRLTQSDLGAQGLLRWQAQTDTPTVWAPTTPGNPSPPIVQVLPPVAQTTLLVLDTSLLRAQDDDTGLYFAAVSADVTWRGATLVRSLDGSTDWTAVATFTTLARSGTASSVLGDRPTYNSWDRASTVDITMASGSPDNNSADLVLSGQAVLGLLGQELLYWQTATLVSGTTWRLSMLLRGRHGTEWAMGSHTAGEPFVLLDPGAIQRYAAPATDLNQTRYYKAVSNGQNVADAATLAVVNTGQGQMCYAPEHVRGTRDASNNLTVTWIPRTRLPWETLDGRVGPLGENLQRYAVSILPSIPATTLLRSWMVDTPTAVYAASDQAADGFTPGAPIPVAVQMINQYVGNGHAAEVMV